MSLKIYGEIGIKNVKYFYRIMIPACIGILFITALLFPSAGLSVIEVCKPIEKFLSFVGIVTMSTIFLPEQDKSIYDSVACRKCSMEIIYLLRLLISVVLMVVSVSSYCIYLKWNECFMNPYLMAGGVISAFFMGSIVFFVAGVSGSTISGIMAAVIYYLCNIGLKKQLGVFYLFQMSAGVNTGKRWLLISGLVLILLTFVIRRVQSK